MLKEGSSMLSPTLSGHNTVTQPTLDIKANTINIRFTNIRYHQHPHFVITLFKLDKYRRLNHHHDIISTCLITSPVSSITFKIEASAIIFEIHLNKMPLDVKYLTFFLTEARDERHTHHAFKTSVEQDQQTLIQQHFEYQSLAHALSTLELVQDPDGWHLNTNKQTLPGDLQYSLEYFGAEVVEAACPSWLINNQIPNEFKAHQATQHIMQELTDNDPIQNIDTPDQPDIDSSLTLLFDWQCPSPDHHKSVPENSQARAQSLSLQTSLAKNHNTKNYFSGILNSHKLIDTTIGALVKLKSGGYLNLPCQTHTDNAHPDSSRQESFHPKGHHTAAHAPNTINAKRQKIVKIAANQWQEIDELIIYASIYSGINNWDDIQAQLTLQTQHGSSIKTQLDSHTRKQRTCAIIRLKNLHDHTQVMRINQYFKSYKMLERAFKIH